MSEINLAWAEIWPIAPAAAAVVLTLGKIIIVYVALRGTAPADRPKIILALAELFRWRRRSDRR